MDPSEHADLSEHADFDQDRANNCPQPVQTLCITWASPAAVREPASAMQHDDVIWQVLGPTPPRDPTGASLITYPSFSLPRR